MSSISDNLTQLRGQLPPEVLLVAVSKTKPLEDLQAAYDAGQRDFGENRVQEMAEKHAALPQDIRWHMIGHVQTNKIKDFVSWVHLVHGVDRLKVLEVLQTEAAKAGRAVDALLQVHIAQEETKFGFSSEELIPLMTYAALSAYPNVRIRGLMGMASFTPDQQQVAREFAELRALFLAGKEQLGWDYFDTLSMGMSGDWPVAVANGSTLIRVGSALFGSR
ncbi:MAG: YggS family pyridoxal phosphate-dependent enzyme [Schleiferiaceae bacterium]|jgi:PLP dependent protein|nr:YggS family pyridoxal phosphate-dependent enzyme [Schleiferiaceae bacterium]MDP4741884.1 YggS family pyridoxal phosphate-dependent enzyme [Schleiferiaceae bacterium]